jgi:hypothetical protein
MATSIDMLHDMISNPKRAKAPSKQKSENLSIERELCDLCNDIAHYYRPSTQAEKAAFLHHLSKGIQQCLKDWKATSHH